MDNSKKIKATMILGYKRTGEVDPELSWDVSLDGLTHINRIQIMPTTKAPEKTEMAGYGKKKSAGKKKSKYK